jgi:hypothetical protein
LEFTTTTLAFDWLMSLDWNHGVNPTITSYNASVVEFTTKLICSLARF